MLMLLKPRQSFIYFLKKIQFSIATWINAVEIARAYTGPKDTIIRHLPTPPKAVMVILYSIIGAMAVSMLWFTFLRNQNWVHLRFAKRTEITQKRRNANIVVPPPPPVDKPVQPPVLRADSVPRDSTILTEVDTMAVVADAPDTAVHRDTLQLPEREKPKVTLFEFREVKDTTAFFIIVANKAFKTLHLLQRQETDGWKPVREYNIAIGEEEGRKRVAGDRRTPEGYYFIVGRKENRELAKIYGPLAYVLNYPNEDDVKAGRTGQGIWIHGTDPDSLPLETRGCLEMKNSNIKELSTILGGGIGTPVIIINDTTVTDPSRAFNYMTCFARRREIVERYRTITEEFARLLTAWKNAWETKNISEYETFYDTAGFFGQGLHWDGWRQRKLRTFDLYDTIAISVDRIFVADYTDSEVVVKFWQNYTTNLNEIQNAKKLSFEKVNQFWKITGESTCPKEELSL
jgi:murein L,D-transpeptidase YafK